MLDAIAAEVDDYHLLHAARGTMLRRLELRKEARVAFERAGQLAATEADRRFLAQQIDVLEEYEAHLQSARGGSSGSTNEAGTR